MEQIKPTIKRPVIYIFVNKSLGMSAGKIAAQASHATALSICVATESKRLWWLGSVHRTLIVLEARNTEHLENIQNYLREREFNTYRQIDEGMNEVDPQSLTAISSDILYKDDEEVIAAFSTFKLYKDTVRINLEIDR